MVPLLLAFGVVVVVTLLLGWREYVGDSLMGGYSGRDKGAMAKLCDGPPTFVNLDVLDQHRP